MSSVFLFRLGVNALSADFDERLTEVTWLQFPSLSTRSQSMAGREWTPLAVC